MLNPFSPGSGVKPTALEGRAAENEAFDLLIARTKQRRPNRSMLLTGLRGVGKTVLLNQFASQAVRNSWPIVSVETQPGEAGQQMTRKAFARALGIVGRKLNIKGGAGLPNLPGRLSSVRSYAERLFDYRFIGPLDPESAGAAITGPMAKFRWLSMGSISKVVLSKSWWRRQLAIRISCKKFPARIWLSVVGDCAAKAHHQRRREACGGGWYPATGHKFRHCALAKRHKRRAGLSAGNGKRRRRWVMHSVGAAG